MPCFTSLAAIQEARINSRAEQKLQSRFEEFIQGCGHHRLDQARSVARVLRGSSGQGDAGGNGAPDLGQEDCHHRIGPMEERSVLRRPTSETTNSLSVSGWIGPIPGFFLAVAVRFWRQSGSRAS